MATFVSTTKKNDAYKSIQVKNDTNPPGNFTFTKSGFKVQNGNDFYEISYTDSMTTSLKQLTLEFDTMNRHGVCFNYNKCLLFSILSTIEQNISSSTNFEDTKDEYWDKLNFIHGELMGVGYDFLIAKWNYTAMELQKVNPNASEIVLTNVKEGNKKFLFRANFPRTMLKLTGDLTVDHAQPGRRFGFDAPGNLYHTMKELGFLSFAPLLVSIKSEVLKSLATKKLGSVDNVLEESSHIMGSALDDLSSELLTKLKTAIKTECGGKSSDEFYECFKAAWTKFNRSINVTNDVGEVLSKLCETHSMLCLFLKDQRSEVALPFICEHFGMSVSVFDGNHRVTVNDSMMLSNETFPCCVFLDTTEDEEFALSDARGGHNMFSSQDYDHYMCLAYESLIRIIPNMFNKLRGSPSPYARSDLVSGGFYTNKCVVFDSETGTYASTDVQDGDIEDHTDDGVNKANELLDKISRHTQIVNSAAATWFWLSYNEPKIVCVMLNYAVNCYIQKKLPLTFNTICGTQRCPTQPSRVARVFHMLNFFIQKHNLGLTTEQAKVIFRGTKLTLQEWIMTYIVRRLRTKNVYDKLVDHIKTPVKSITTVRQVIKHLKQLFAVNVEDRVKNLPKIELKYMYRQMCAELRGNLTGVVEDAVDVDEKCPNMVQIFSEIDQKTQHLTRNEDMQEDTQEGNKKPVSTTKKNKRTRHVFSAAVGPDENSEERKEKQEKIGVERSERLLKRQKQEPEQKHSFSIGQAGPSGGRSCGVTSLAAVGAIDVSGEQQSSEDTESYLLPHEVAEDSDCWGGLKIESIFAEETDARAADDEVKLIQSFCKNIGNDGLAVLQSQEKWWSDEMMACVFNFFKVLEKQATSTSCFMGEVKKSIRVLEKYLYTRKKDETVLVLCPRLQNRHWVLVAIDGHKRFEDQGDGSDEGTDEGDGDGSEAEPAAEITRIHVFDSLMSKSHVSTYNYAADTQLHDILSGAGFKSNDDLSVTYEDYDRNSTPQLTNEGRTENGDCGPWVCLFGQMCHESGLHEGISRIREFVNSKRPAGSTGICVRNIFSNGLKKALYLALLHQRNTIDSETKLNALLEALKQTDNVDYERKLLDTGAGATIHKESQNGLCGVWFKRLKMLLLEGDQFKTVTTHSEFQEATVLWKNSGNEFYHVGYSENAPMEIVHQSALDQLHILKDVKALPRAEALLENSPLLIPQDGKQRNIVLYSLLEGFRGHILRKLAYSCGIEVGDDDEEMRSALFEKLSSNHA